MASTAGYLARRAAQKERVRLLYRRALKDTLNWRDRHHVFYHDASDLRDKFEANRLVDNLDVIDRLIDDAETQCRNLQHPDPHIVPLAPGASKFTRNPPPPQGDNLDMIDRLIDDADSQCSYFQHLDPYIAPWAPGSSKFTRNPPPPQGDNPDMIDRLIDDADSQCSYFQHLDPYIVPLAPGGSKFTRNPPPPQGAFFRGFWKPHLGISGFRGFSATTTDVSEKCVIRGVNQDIFLPRSMFQSILEHEAEFPLFEKIPKLLRIPDGPTHQLSDHWRRILYSGFLHSYHCKLQQDCISNAFDLSNVGVVKGLNILAFRKFHRNSEKNVDHSGYCEFVKDQFVRNCGQTPFIAIGISECQKFLSDCRRVDVKDNDVVLSQHPFFLEDEQLADVYSEIHRLTRHELKHRKMGREAVHILKHLESVYSNQNLVNGYIPIHPLFQLMLGGHSPSALQVKIQPDRCPGSHRALGGTAVVDLHRIVAQHGIEDNVMKLLYRYYPHLSNIWRDYSRADLMRYLRYLLPRYASEALYAFKSAGVLHRLAMHRRLPIPCLFEYISPPNNVEPGP